MLDSRSTREESQWSPEQELAARAAEMRRWSQGLLAVGLFLILLMAGMTVFLFKQISKHEAALAGIEKTDQEEAPPRSKPAGTPLVDDKKVASAVPVPPPPLIDPEPRPEPKPTVPPTPEPTKPPPPLPAGERDKYLEALGKLTGVNLYQTYLNIGLMADVVERKIYTKAQVRPWLDRVSTQLQLINNSVEPLLQTDDEKADFEQCQKVAALLLATTNELKAYWDTNDKATADKYHKSRDAAWMALSELLDLAPPASTPSP